MLTGAELEFQTEELENDFQGMNIESNKAYFGNNRDYLFFK